MKKVVDGKRVSFYSEDGSEIMYMDFPTDECIWFFNTDKTIEITSGMELYDSLENWMEQDYTFFSGILNNYKDQNKLVWYSDCYYDPDDEWSVESVSCLNIERRDNRFYIWCNRKLDERINRVDRTFCICFSPGGNGQFNKSVKSELTLQDDFVTFMYHPLVAASKMKLLNNKKELY